MNRAVPALAIAGVCLLLTACSKSDSDVPASGQSAAPPPGQETGTQPSTAATAPEPAATTPTNSAAEAVVQAAETLLGEQARNLLPPGSGISSTGSNAPAAARLLGEVAKGRGGDWGGLLKSLADENADPVLNSIGGELGQTASRLKQSLEGDAGLTGAVQTAVESLLAGQDSGALGLYSKLTKAGLTPEQKELASETRNLTAAFLAQRSLSALDGAEGQVATVVNALRKGEVATALPAIKELASNASLTPSQKGLLNSLALEYAPGLSELRNSLPAGLPVLPPSPGGQN